MGAATKVPRRSDQSLNKLASPDITGVSYLLPLHLASPHSRVFSSQRLHNTCRSPSVNIHIPQEETHGVQREERLEVLDVHMMVVGVGSSAS